MADHPPIGYWLRLVDRLIENKFAETLDEHGVTRCQWQLFNVLDTGPAPVEKLDAAVTPFLSPAEGETSADHLNELVESEWVISTPAGYEITELGRAAFERLRTVVATQRTVASEGVSEEEYLGTIRVLERMAQNLGWTGAP